MQIGIYLVTSGNDRRTVETAVAAVRGGVGMVQVRAKNLSTRDLLALTIEIAGAVHCVADVPVLVDDSAEVAFTARRANHPVAGVHLGQDDLPVSAARDLLGPDAIIGLTTGTLALVEESAAVAKHLNYLGAGPFRPTPTKDSGRPPLGIDGYRPLIAATHLPLVAIGDIQLDDIEPLARLGVSGVAVVRSLMGAQNPEATARAMVAAWQRGSAH